MVKETTEKKKVRETTGQKILNLIMALMKLSVAVVLLTPVAVAGSVAYDTGVLDYGGSEGSDVTSHNGVPPPDGANGEPAPGDRPGDEATATPNATDCQYGSATANATATQYGCDDVDPAHQGLPTKAPDPPPHPPLRLPGRHIASSE
jgi:hypothetical protein